MPKCICGHEECVLYEAVISAKLPEQAVCEIQGLISKQHYQAGEVIFHEGESCSHFHILTNGLAKLVTQLDDGREQIIGLGSPFYLLGFSHIEDQHYHYTAVAAIPTSICRIRYKVMLQILQQHPDTALRVIATLHKELNQTRDLLRVIGHKTVSEKLASFILSLLPRNQQSRRELPLPLSRQEIAELLGLREETVCRAMAELKRAGVIHAPRGRVIIQNLEQLIAIAQGKGINPLLMSAQQ